MLLPSQGVWVTIYPYTQGRCLGYELIGLSARIIDFCTPSFLSLYFNSLKTKAIVYENTYKFLYPH